MVKPKKLVKPPPPKPKPQPSDELLTLCRIEKEAIPQLGVKLDEQKDILLDIGSVLEQKNAKVTRDSAGLVTKIEEMVGDKTFETTYTRDSSDDITKVGRLVILKRLQV